MAQDEISFEDASALDVAQRFDSLSEKNQLLASKWNLGAAIIGGGNKEMRVKSRKLKMKAREYETDSEAFKNAAKALLDS